MRAEEVAPVCVVPSHTRGAYRRRRLARGVARWNLDRINCAEPTRRIARLTLTVHDADPMAARARARDFWAKVRKRWLGTRYFCWLELQRRGAVHYHAIWLNPPHVKRVNLIAWVQKAWGSDRTQVRFSDGRRGLEEELEYVQGYTKKMGRKAYQQQYDAVPRELRTFMCQRLDILPAALDEHLDRWQVDYIPEGVVRDERDSRHVREHLVLRARLTHVVDGHISNGNCEVIAFRRRPAGDRPPWWLPPPLSPVQKARLQLQRLSPAVAAHLK